MGVCVVSATEGSARGCNARDLNVACLMRRLMYPTRTLRRLSHSAYAVSAGAETVTCHENIFCNQHQCINCQCVGHSVCISMGRGQPSHALEP
jgi:hypothetical protein